MTKRKMICAECKSDDVVVDAWAEWDVPTQDWVLRTAFDDAYCLACENACDVEEPEVEEEPTDADVKRAIAELLWNGGPTTIQTDIDRDIDAWVEWAKVSQFNPLVHRAIKQLMGEHMMKTLGHSNWTLPRSVVDADLSMDEDKGEYDGFTPKDNALWTRPANKNHNED